MADFPQNPHKGLSNRYGRLFLAWINFDPEWTTDCIHYKVYNEITNLFPNFNGCAVEILESDK